MVLQYIGVRKECYESYDRWIDSLWLWRHRYIMEKDLIFPMYLITEQVDSIYDPVRKILEILFKRSLFSDIYLFLVKFVETIGKYTYRSYEIIFLEALQEFIDHHPYFFEY